MKETSINVDTVEFDNVPIELTDSESELDNASKTEVEPEQTAEEKVDSVFKEEAAGKKKRKERMKENPPALKLRNPKKLHGFAAKDYIIMRCNICEKDMTTARKDDDGNFEPRALCQHLVFKGLIAEK